jgi:hypothetical protein
MTMTINSGASSFCTPAQFVQIFDFRTFAQLASDSDIPLNSSAAFQASSITAAMLQIGAGLIEMAATVSARYDPADLALLAATAPPTNGGWALIQMNAALAAAEFFKRRFEAIPEAIAKVVEDAQAKLAALEDGTAIFSFANVQQAGIVTDYKETPQDVEARNLPSFITRRCLGIRANRRLPPY